MNTENLVPISEELSEKVRLLGIEPVLTFALPRDVVEAMASLAQEVAQQPLNVPKKAKKTQSPPIKRARIPLNPTSTPEPGTQTASGYAALSDAFERGETFTRDQCVNALLKRGITAAWMLTDLCRGGYIEVLERGYK